MKIFKSLIFWLILLIFFTFLLIIFIQNNKSKSIANNVKTKNNTTNLINTQTNNNTTNLINTQTNNLNKEKFIKKKEVIESIKNTVENKKLKIKKLTHIETMEYEELTKPINYLDKSRPVYANKDNIFLNIGGNVVQITNDDVKYYAPSISPNNNYIAFHGLGKGIYSYDVRNNILKETGINGGYIAWHPNSLSIIYSVVLSDDGHSINNSDIYLYNIKNSKNFRITNTQNTIERRPVFSYDGQYIYYEDSNFLKKDGLFRVPFDKAEKMH